MEIQLANQLITFKNVELNFSCYDRENLFELTKNTLRETYENKRYSSLKRRHGKLYEEHLDFPLGVFLLHLKTNNNEHYKQFLNKHGDKKFCKFQISEFLPEKGIYCYGVKGKILYVGKTIKSFKERINDNYGSVSPYTCTKNGQSTNCHINSLLNDLKNEVKLGVYCMSEKTDMEIERLENEILTSDSYEWNVQLQRKKRSSH